MRQDYSSGVHEFMRTTTTVTDAKLAALERLAAHERAGGNRNSASFCLNSAVSYFQPEMAAILIDKYGADVQQASTLFGHADTKATFNLLHDALQSYEVSPYIDRSLDTQRRLAGVVELLLQRGVSAAPNPDPHDNPIHSAAHIAFPHLFVGQYNDSQIGLLPEFSPAENFVSFKQPYELIRKYQPDVVAAYEYAFPKVKRAAQDEYQTLYARPAAETDAADEVIPDLFGFSGIVLRTEFGEKARGAALWQRALDHVVEKAHKVVPRHTHG